MIPITRPTIGEEEVEATAEVLRSGWVSQGPRVAAFEQGFSEYVGAEHACAVSSCTAALHLALLAVGVQAGDEVITVSHSFIATANAIRYCGAVPVFVDIDPKSYNIDPALIEPAISERTKAILCVHQVGMPCDMPAILRDRITAWHSGSRRCRLCDWQRNSHWRDLGAHRQTPWRHRLFFLSSAKGYHRGGRGYADDQ